MDKEQKKYKKNQSKISDIGNDFNAQTIYVGKRGENNNSILRIYNKKAEQLGGKS